MNRPVIILTVICAVMLLDSCRRVVVDSLEKETFLGRSEIGFYPEGEPVFVFREQIHQMCVNKGRLQFRIQTSRQDTCMNVILETEPERDGDLVMCSFDYTDTGSGLTDLFQFECSRVSGGKVWLWDGYTRTGVIIRRF